MSSLAQSSILEPGKSRKPSNIIYSGHDRPFHINVDGSTRYLPGVTTLKVPVGFAERDMGTSVTIALEPIKQPWVFPETQG